MLMYNSHQNHINHSHTNHSHTGGSHAQENQLKPKAVALISGGLDSMLAAKVVLDQGVHVEGINFYTGFCVESHTSSIRARAGLIRRNNALWVAEQLGIKLHIIDIAEEYKEIVLNPKHGYGQHLNPCLDCKIFMIARAQEWAIGRGYDFIVTGEVMGQRPKSQRKQAMPLIARESGVADRLLRPLCAKHMPESLPEREGWVDRSKLHGFHGRNRKPQIELARAYGFEDWAQPAGGCCFLTNEHYSAKLADLWAARGERDYSLDDIVLLKVGRHLRPAPHWKMIISREDGENFYLAGYRQLGPFLRTLSHGGPVALLDGSPTTADVDIAARTLARYGQGRTAQAVSVQVDYPDGRGEVRVVAPYHEMEIPKGWHI